MKTTSETALVPEGRKLRLAVLGASGSIGTQTLDVVRHHKDKAEIVCLSVHTRTDVAAAAAREFGCRLIAVTDPAQAHDAALEDLPEGTKVLVGPEALVELATRDDVDCVVSAVVGFAGIESSYAAAKAGKSAPEPTAQERMAMALRHARALVEQKGPHAVVEMRKHVAWYVKGMPGAAGIRAAVNECVTLGQLEALLGGACPGV